MNVHAYKYVYYIFIIYVCLYIIRSRSPAYQMYSSIYINLFIFHYFFSYRFLYTYIQMHICITYLTSNIISISFIRIYSEAERKCWYDELEYQRKLHFQWNSSMTFFYCLMIMFWDIWDIYPKPAILQFLKPFGYINLSINLLD